MRVKFNDKELSISDNTTLSMLLEQLELPSAGVALAVNDNVVSRSKWQDILLHENDKIIVIKAVCGG